MIDEYKVAAAPGRLTHENHPENRQETVAAPAKKSGLPGMIAVSILGGLIGMVYGVAALSSALVLNEPASLLSVIPIVVALVVLEAGYWGAIVWMCKSETEGGAGD
jgi:hypothetical protein